jgi:hypothetical protein
VTFRQAVDGTRDLEGAWRAGLGAVHERDRNRLRTEQTRRLSGSVDVESALTPRYRDERQWDYAVGFRPTNTKAEVVYWLEVHPANEGEVRVVLEKLEFLRRWLRENGPKLNAMPKAFIWISSGRTSFTRTSPQQKRLSLAGLQHGGGSFTIPADFVL